MLKENLKEENGLFNLLDFLDINKLDFLYFLANDKQLHNLFLLKIDDFITENFNEDVHGYYNKARNK